MSSGRGRPVLRRCVACRTLADRSGLLRVIRLACGGISVEGGFGRSAYLCASQACLEEARRRKRLQKGLRCPVPDSVLQLLQERLEAGDDAGAEAR